MKRPTRIARLQNSAKHALELRSSCEEKAKKAGRILESFRTLLSAPWQGSLWPPPPFLVPSVIEGLLSSNYAGITEVMPGEADHYCTVVARELASQSLAGLHIFTNDSDLLVLNTANDTRVVLLNSLTYNESDNLTADVFNPTAITKSLGLQDLLGVAYRMKHDSHMALDVAASLVLQGANQTSPGYEHFLAELDNTTVDVAFGINQQAYVGRMDPRLSELVCQTAAKDASEDPDDSPCMFLPFMIDDIHKASAWRCGSDLRKLAYTVLAHGGTFTAIDEFDRRGDRVVACRVDLYHDLLQALHSYRDWLSQQLSAVQSKDTQSPWRVIAAITLLCDLQAQDKPAPALADITTVVCTGKLSSWAQIHLTAQLNAVLYSFRMLKLALGFKLAGHDLAWPDRHVHGLSGLLTTLPPLSELFVTLSEQDCNAFTDLIQLHCDTDGETPRPRKRIRKTAQSLSDRQDDRHHANNEALANNPFAMLAE